MKKLKKNLDCIVSFRVDETVHNLIKKRIAVTDRPGISTPARYCRDFIVREVSKDLLPGESIT